MASVSTAESSTAAAAAATQPASVTTLSRPSTTSGRPATTSKKLEVDLKPFTDLGLALNHNAKHEDVDKHIAHLRSHLESGKTLPIETRIKHLNALIKMMKENELAFVAAGAFDSGKNKFNSTFFEVYPVIKESELCLKNIRKWSSPQTKSTPLATLPGWSKIVPQPKGVVLMISPWNFPITLSLRPLASALAAGNTVLLKPSEVSPHVSALLAHLIPKYLNDVVRVVEGGVPETTYILKQKFDHIAYTGNPMVGKIVMRAAAEHLTPVTLELGGKCPVYVDKTANLQLAANRICWGKFANAGQICIAPDYVMVHKDVKDTFVQLFLAAIKAQYGENPKEANDYERIVNERHLKRLEGFLHDHHEGKILAGGLETVDKATKYFPPTVVDTPKKDSMLMKDEIFGPILPIFAVDDVKAAMKHINEGERPLAAYIFTAEAPMKETFLTHTWSGAVVINDVIFHYTNSAIPFGGVGHSGMGAFHGQVGFETFSHMKAVLEKSAMPITDLAVRYAPYDESKFNLFRRVMDL